MDNWLAYGVPAGAAILAVLGLLSSWLQARSFDRKHPRPHHPAGE